MDPGGCSLDCSHTWNTNFEETSGYAGVQSQYGRLGPDSGGNPRGQLVNRAHPPLCRLLGYVSVNAFFGHGPGLDAFPTAWSVATKEPIMELPRSTLAGNRCKAWHMIQLPTEVRPGVFNFRASTLAYLDFFRLYFKRNVQAILPNLYSALGSWTDILPTSAASHLSTSPTPGWKHRPTACRVPSPPSAGLVCFAL